MSIFDRVREMFGGDKPADIPQQATGERAEDTARDGLDGPRDVAGDQFGEYDRYLEQGTDTVDRIDGREG
jgi:hypothetical protein